MNKGFELAEAIDTEKYGIPDKNKLSLWLCSAIENKKTILSCFTIYFDTTKDLDLSWEKFVTEIAINYINEQTDKFSIWNCYCVFICSHEVPKELKYKIENNKFAMRKIVIDSFPQTIDQTEICNTINNRILSFNVKKSLVSQTGSPTRPPIILSSLSNDLLKTELIADRTNQSIDDRNEWINKQLKRLEDNENQKS
ncbi:ABC-three component system middle component 1 [Morganella morganii]|uniref:ABC-three component system middle component 1 n=1 Tax=Morganella morganii TaxID=582 RepID=UPI003EB72CCD